MASALLEVLEFAQSAALILTALLFLTSCVSQHKYDALEALNQEMAAEIGSNEMQIAQLQAALKITMNYELLFPSGGWQMSPAAQDQMDKLVRILASIGATKILVNGYTDNRPIRPELMRQGITNNLALSQKRADNVMHFIISHRINPSFVSAQGFGDADPVAPNDTAAGRAQNRRVELTLAESGREMLSNALPPTTVVASSSTTSPTASGKNAPSRPPDKVVADPKPSIVWHQVNGHWRWHCTAHCSQFAIQTNPVPFSGSDSH